MFVALGRFTKLQLFFWFRKQSTFNQLSPDKTRWKIFLALLIQDLQY